jgi:hypothetical protein
LHDELIQEIVLKADLEKIMVESPKYQKRKEEVKNSLKVG